MVENIVTVPVPVAAVKQNDTLLDQNKANLNELKRLVNQGYKVENHTTNIVDGVMLWVFLLVKKEPIANDFDDLF